ncbi:MAG: polysaccharide biosynthesis/export family protein [Lentisphaerae bacterium]|nr:polysaccharide biosynthesis/export family protein [Lentisphaerota bacterium]
MKIKPFILIALFGLALLAGGCQSVPRDALAKTRESEMQAELDLAASQSKAILQEITAAGRATFQIGDKIAIQVWLKDKISQLSGYPLELTVPESGEIFLPHIGLSAMAGKAVEEFQAELQGVLDKILKDVTVVVSRKGERTFVGREGKGMPVELRKSFVVMGHISHPGLYPLEPGVRVRDAIALAGGLAHYAHPNIYLVRGSREKPEVKRINLKKIFFGTSLENNVLLAANDAIYVMPVMLYRTADFITLLLSPVTAVRDSLYVYDRLAETSP